MLVSDSLHDWSRRRGCAGAIASYDASSQNGCSCDRTRRALSLLVDHATQRETFCVKLSDRQSHSMVNIHLDDLPAEQSGSCGIWFK
jgi:hypothetical protein